MASNTGFATAPAEGISQDQYQSGSWNFYRGVNINNTQATQQLAAPSASLAQQSGIKTTVEKPDINVQLGRIHDPSQRDDSYFNVLTGQTGFNSEGVSFDYDTMINNGVGENKKDSVDWAGGFGETLAGVSPAFALLSGIGGGKQGFGATLDGPTGKKVFSIGQFSEKALNKHYKNFTESSASYDEMKKQGGTPYNTDTGFAATIGNNHISRAPGQKHFDGLLSVLHSDSGTAFNIARSMEAIKKGLDPRGSGGFKGYSLTGDNSDNRGGSDAYHPSGMGMVTNDGYYTYADGGSALGHTKVKLRGGVESLAILDNLKGKGYNITMTQMMAAMETARTGGASFSEGIKKYKGISHILEGAGQAFTNNNVAVNTRGGHFDSAGKWTGNVNWNETGDTFGKDTSQISNWVNTPVGTAGSKYIPSWRRPIDKSSVTAFDTGMVNTSLLQKAVKSGEITSPLPDFKKAVQEQYSGGGRDLAAEEAAQKEAEENRAKAKLDAQVDRYEGGEGTYGKRWVGGLASGGQVSSPVGQLANMLRSNRLGYNTGGRVKGGVYGYQDGGQVNLQEMGFVNGKTPDQVTDAQSVADTEEASVDDGDFIINAPAVEAVGVEPLMDLMMNALNTASEEGVQIVDISRDTSPDEMVEIFISEGEFVVPRELIPFVEGGIETLEKINALGTDEVSRRAGEGEFNEEAMMEQMSSLEAPPEEIPEPQPMRYGDRVKRIIPSEGFV